MNRNSKVFFMIALLFITYNTIQAQTLIRETSNTKKNEKSWKVEWGLLTGMGVSNVLRPDVEARIALPESASTYRTMYAARPEAEIGFFGEIGKTSSIFSFQAHLSYTMRAVPEPVFYNNSSNVKEVYKSTYLNGGTIGALFCFKPVDRFKVGVGLDLTRFLILDDVVDSDIGEYTGFFKSSAGLKLVVSYQVSPRVDLNVYSRFGRLDDFDAARSNGFSPDDISVGMTVAYRLLGKEIRYKETIIEEKQVYKLNYK